MCAAEARARAVSAAEAKRLFDPLAQASTLILAVSGGPDSTALLMLAARWRAARKAGPKLLAVTIDHGLRPQAAREAGAVKRLARALGVPHRTLRWQGSKPRTGLQQAARAARYRLLADFARVAKAEHILTAHTLDDQAETVLMRMSRGSGISGLAAMREVAPVACSSRRARSVVLVRPLLAIPKARLIATLARAGIAYADDASNRDPRFTRARWREVMPALAREGLDAPRLALLARRLARAENALECAVDAAAADVSMRTLRDRTKDDRNAAVIVLDAQKFFALPAEIALRLLGRAIVQAGDAAALRLGKLEALLEALAFSMSGAPHPMSGAPHPTPLPAGGEREHAQPRSREGRVRLRRTLGGALVSLTASRLVVERAPPRALRAPAQANALTTAAGLRARIAQATVK